MDDDNIVKLDVVINPYLYEFAQIIIGLLIVGKVISEDDEVLDKMREEPPFYFDFGKNPLVHADKVLYAADCDLMYWLNSEIEEFCEKRPQNVINAFGKELLNVFKLLVPYLDKISDIKIPTDCNKALKRQLESYDILCSIPEDFPKEDYVHSCNKAIQEFLYNIDLIFLSFEIDLIKIQNELNIHLIKERDLRIHDKAYERKLERKKSESLRTVPQNKKKNITHFPEYLKHEKSDELAAKLKQGFNTGKGKRIRLLIEALKTHEPPLLNIVKGDMKGLILSLKNYFDRDIGTYSGINDYQIISKDSGDINTIKKSIDSILRKL